MNQASKNVSVGRRARSTSKHLLSLIPLLGALGCTAQVMSDGSQEARVGSAEQAVCNVTVDPLRSIVMVNPSIIETARASNALDGPWSFRALLERMAQTPAQADVDRLVRSIFESWLSNQTINGQTIGARNSVDQVIMQQFEIPGSNPRSFDLSRAPYQLIGIASRLDLRSPSDAGELRFVFGFLQNGVLGEMTMNFEYKIPFTAALDTATKWAAKLHELDALDPTANPTDFAAKLQEITDIVTARGAFPTKPNGSAIGQIRTNEIVLVPVWEMREFNMTSAGVMAPATTKNSPNHNSIDNSNALRDFLAQTPSLGATNDTSFMSVAMPLNFEGQPFLGGVATETGFDTWILGSDTKDTSVALDNFGLLTCNGCHLNNKAPGDIAFYQISPVQSTLNPITHVNDGTGRLSQFMLAGDPAKDGRRPAELARRAADMTNVLCSAPSGPDLVVTGAGWSPSNVAPGQSATFSATVQNQGTTATPAGTIIGVAFNVDGTLVTWSDTNAQSLAPGASVTLSANNGPSGRSTWTATSGGHTLQAWVDDVNRIPESDENNNKLSLPLSIGIDLVVSSVSLSPAHPAPGAPTTFSAVVKNQGTLATPSGTIVGVAFNVDGTQVSWSDTNKQSLAPGASVTLTANSGPSGSATWPATAGSHALQAWVDDVNRMNDVNRSNNKLQSAFSLP